MEHSLKSGYDGEESGRVPVIRFTAENPIPKEIIEKLVLARMTEIG
jgi:hypothetical protein